MKKVAIFWLFGLFALNVAAYDMGIVTGGEKGTYIKIGKNMRDLLSLRSKINLNVYQSQGSMQNVVDVFQRKGVQLGIVQSDVLTFIELSDDEYMKRIAKKIKLVFPLYNEEVHILAQNNLKSIADLHGKRVALGKEGSGTFLTSTTILSLADIKPKEKYLVGGETALEALKTNRIDAMFYVAGYPVALFVNDVKVEDNLNLLSITDKSVIENYPESTIPTNTYTWQENDLNTVSVKATLITFDYKGINCSRVSELASIIYNNKGWLDNNGHSKWRTVDLAASLTNWERYECLSDSIPLFPDSSKPVASGCDGIKNPIARELCRTRLD